MLINELMDTKIKGRVIKDTKNHYHVKALIGGRYIQFEAMKAEEGVWSVSFLELDEDGDETTYPTGSGSELKVFSFVVDCFEEMVIKHRPNLFIFTAEHEGKNQTRNSRAELYKRLFKKFKMRNYKMITQDIPGATEFFIEREGSNAYDNYGD